MTCPKCGARPAAFTTAVSAGADHLSLFRCEVCSARFVKAGMPPAGGDVQASYLGQPRQR